jgi:hypothetical protein
MDKRIKIKKYSKHPEIEGDELQVVIMKKPIIIRKPKPPRMTINQLALIVGQQGTKLDQLLLVVNNLALEMHAGFTTINKRIDKLEDEVVGIKDVLKRNNLH